MGSKQGNDKRRFHHTSVWLLLVNMSPCFISKVTGLVVFQCLCAVGDGAFASHLVHERPKVSNCVSTGGTSSKVCTCSHLYLFKAIYTSFWIHFPLLQPCQLLIFPPGTVTALPSSCAVFMKVWWCALPGNCCRPPSCPVTMNHLSDAPSSLIPALNKTLINQGNLYVTRILLSEFHDGLRGWHIFSGKMGKGHTGCHLTTWIVAGISCR